VPSTDGRRFRPTFWATVFTVPAILFMLGLGVWQLQRLQWKEALIAEIQAGVSADPVPLPSGAIDPEAWRFKRVTVTGTFDHAKEMHLLAHTERGNIGYQVITPLQRADDGTWVLVNRGWVPADDKDPATRAAGQVAGIVTITGITRPTWPQRTFVPDNEPDTNHWYFGDLAAMARHAGIEAAPVFVEADATPNAGGLPMGGQTPVNLPNNHLQYALTWFMLAAGLGAVYVVYHWRRPTDT
jgi:surfeit locus 1 family protein